MRYSLIPVTIIAAALAACSQQESAQAPAVPAADKVAEKAMPEKAEAAVKETVEKTEDAVKETVEKAADATTAAVSSAAEKTTEAASSMMDKAKVMATDAAVAAGVPVPLVEQHAPKAVAAIKSFAKTLQGELKAAMSNGGAPNAISVCNEKAPAIAQQLSEESGYTLARVSMKNRNPDQAASGWNKEVLEKFEERLAAGEDINTLAFKTVVTKEDGGQEFRMMKAIPTGKVCLNCHGEEVKPEVEAKLNELYPDDKARGYTEGMIRGAFVVTKDLE